MLEGMLIYIRLFLSVSHDTNFWISSHTTSFVLPLSSKEEQISGVLGGGGGADRGNWPRPPSSPAYLET